VEPDDELARRRVRRSAKPCALPRRTQAGCRQGRAGRSRRRNIEREDADSATNDCWHISIRFGRDVLKNGMDPLAFLRYLLNLGEVAHITTLTDALPDAEEMDPELCYLGFEISFRSHASKDAIERVFDFCRDDCDLHILPPNSKVEDYLGN
jgi:two-component system chemotaxis sensor kinase CheA